MHLSEEFGYTVPIICFSGFCFGKDRNSHYVSPCEEFRCSHYIRCVDGVTHETPCPPGTVHNPAGSWDKACDHQRNVASCNNGQTDTGAPAQTGSNQPNQPYQPNQNTNINPYVFPNNNQYPIVNPFGVRNQWQPNPFFPRFHPRNSNNNMRF